MIIAYLRVSTEKQNLSNQRSEIERFALQKGISIDRWIMEIASGKKAGKERQLGHLLRRLKKGDTLIITEISRLSRTLTDIMSIMGKCLEKGISLYSVKDGYTFDDSINSKVLCFAFGLVAEIERNLISMRTKEALALRRSEGIVLGRKKGSYTKFQILIDNRNSVINMLKEGKTITYICQHYNLSRDTFEKFKKKYPTVATILKAKDRKKRKKTLD
ncbi:MULTISPECIES: recombinase family protein [Odoribacteraceae]|uniref:recombinase family protein n=1 Tax=Odoribacteraceae TaxID=1853231 RepID=UPI000E4EA2D8|nr:MULTISPECIES: recombinase family protein [Odoribacteraceae]MCQ4875481.1 recombinase family protein [Butyricimonas paravirosa]RHR80329.1 invertase [Odoribacter sp. AF15-53]